MRLCFLLLGCVAISQSAVAAEVRYGVCPKDQAGVTKLVAPLELVSSRPEAGTSPGLSVYGAMSAPVLGESVSMVFVYTRRGEIDELHFFAPWDPQQFQHVFTGTYGGECRHYSSGEVTGCDSPMANYDRVTERFVSQAFSGANMVIHATDYGPVVSLRCNYWPKPSN